MERDILPLLGLGDAAYFLWTNRVVVSLVVSLVVVAGELAFWIRERREIRDAGKKLLDRAHQKHIPTPSEKEPEEEEDLRTELSRLVRRCSKQEVPIRLEGEVYTLVVREEDAGERGDGPGVRYRSGDGWEGVLAARM